ncbi:family 16 glycosylhydrolase [Pedobacter sp. SD-b]|uniref:Family 16 glycosylhydrolase n=1 Tax=Pedobacter segetis TaxID=2793069 RepID=A0ABS1BJ04_9SPHI|nr:family 16 glycosylhydrolase [Pedobacter segetis]MBK0382845.1 family 16 glycosylhydrolase [Pedobacter segetis]
MKTFKLTKIADFLFIASIFIAVGCKKGSTQMPNLKLNEAQTQSSDSTGKWETVLNGTSFTSYQTLEANWNYLYPWGSDHNGTARMYASSTDRSQLYIEEPGILTIKATRIYDNLGISSAAQHLPIHYRSGAINLKQHVILDDKYPTWQISGDFKAPTMRGAWPAFWISSAGPWTAESDILEIKGTPVNHANTYDGGWESNTTNLPDADTKWHNYEVVISRILDGAGNPTLNARCDYYIDGSFIGTHTGSNFYNKEYWVIINMQMEGSGGSPGPTQDIYYYAKNVLIKRFAK